MATRDRTALFLRYRADAERLHHRPSRVGGGSSVTSGDLRARSATSVPGAEFVPIVRSHTGAPEPDWMLLARDLAGDVLETRATLTKLTELQAKHLRPSFGTTDHAELEHAIREVASELTIALHSAETKVKQVAIASGVKSGPLDEEGKIRKNIQKRFASQLQEMSLAFRNKQKDYLTQLRSQREALVSHPANSNRPGPNSDAILVDLRDENEIDSTLDGHEHLLSSDLHADQIVSSLDENLALVNNRDREITKIAANINDLAVIVKDLAVLVVDQGTILDRIDYNVEEIQETTKSAVRELRIADRHQRKRYAFWCILFLSIGCGIMLALLLFKWLG